MTQRKQYQQLYNNLCRETKTEQQYNLTDFMLLFEINKILIKNDCIALTENDFKNILYK